MRLSDIMSAMGLSLYPTVAMIFFLAVFAGVLVRVFRPSARAEMDAAARLPLSDDSTAHTTPGGRPAPEFRP